MGTGDGTVQGLITLVDNGPATQRLNVVLVAEGFRASELDAFGDACDDFVNALRAESWFPVLGRAINVHRLDVASTDSGADDPGTCGDGSSGSGAAPDTFFDVSFCNGGDPPLPAGQRHPRARHPGRAAAAVARAAVLVDTSQRGGCANGDVF